MTFDSVVEDVRGRVNLVEIISGHTDLKQAGRTFKGLCPFHKERSPSFTVDPAKGFYHCFGCGAGGDAFKFVMEIHGLSFPEALEQLARRVGVSLPERRGGPKVDRSRRRVLLEVTRSAALFFRRVLKDDPSASTARDYLRGRGFSVDEALSFGLGYAPNDWEALARHLSRDGADLEAARATGLIGERTRGSGHYDRFRDRLMFTILDAEGTPIGFGARALGTVEGPKYINSSDSDIFHKGRGVYGLSWALRSIREQGRAVVVEGYFDVLSLHQQGITTAVATLGTALTPDHAYQLKRYAPEVVLLFDGDEAGRKAAWRALPHFLAADVRPRAAFLPSGEDPDTLVQKQGAEVLVSMLEAAPPLLEHVIATMARAAGADPRARGQAMRELAPLLNVLPDPVELDATIEVAARAFQVGADSVRRVLDARKDATRDLAPAESDRVAALADPIPPAEEALVRALAEAPGLATLLGGTEVQTAMVNESAARFVHAAANEPTGTSTRWLEGIDDPNLVRLVTSASVEETLPAERGPRVVTDCIRRIQRDRLRAEVDELSHQISQRESRGDIGELQRLQQLKIEKNRRMLALGSARAG
ncbi:MAG: DNA primase [Deltaproteobacteria bacterium]|nr:DNA primase [Deltaproteobacteria bacterium]